MNELLVGIFLSHVRQQAHLRCFGPNRLSDWVVYVARYDARYGEAKQLVDIKLG